MNDKQTITKNYILIVKTLHGDPEGNITVIVKGTNGQTEKLLLGKSQVEIRFILIDENCFLYNFSRIINVLKIIRQICSYSCRILM